jgi:hypothetical protein
MRKIVISLISIFSLIYPVSSYVLSIDGLVASYTFTGNANDSSGNNLNGTVSGAKLTQYRYGADNSAYYFDGVNDYISIADNPLLNIADAITISAWMKEDGESGRTIISKSAPLRQGCISSSCPMCLKAGYFSQLQPKGCHIQQHNAKRQEADHPCHTPRDIFILWSHDIDNQWVNVIHIFQIFAKWG